MRKLLDVSNLFLSLFIGLGILSVLLQMVCILMGRGDVSSVIGTWGIRSANIFGALLAISSYLFAQFTRGKKKEE